MSKEPVTDHDRSADRPRPSSLMARTLNGFSWTFGGAGLQAVLRIVVLAILARLLSPTEFGVVSAALTVAALAELFGRIGVGPAIVQAADLDEAKIRTGSTVTIAAGVIAGAILFLSAPVVAALFQIPTVEPVVRAFSLLFVIGGFAVVPEALLQRNMRFRAIALIAFGSYLFGYALVAVTLAFAGFGIWALVWGHVTQQVLASAAFIILERPRMRPMLDGAALRHLFHFGAGVTLSRVGNYIALNADYFIVGRWLGAEALGYYSRAYLLLLQPALLVGSAGEKVLFPALSSVQSDEKRLLRGYYRAVALSAMTTIPATAVLFVLAPELIYLLLGHQWGLAILPFQILVLSLVFRTAYKLIGSLLRARGSVYLLALWQWIYAALVVAAALSGLSWGIVGVSAGISIAIVVAYWIGAYISGLSSPTSMRTIAIIFARHTVVAVVIFILLYFLRRALVDMGLHPGLIVLCCLAVAGVVFLAAFFLAGKLFGEEGIWIRSMIEARLRRSLHRS